MSSEELDRVVYACGAAVALAFFTGLAAGFWGGTWLHFC